MTRLGCLWKFPSFRKHSVLEVRPIPKTAFLHIPKTAGTTFHHLLLNCFPGGKSLTNAERGSNANVDPRDFDFVSGHFSYAYLVEKGLEEFRILTVLREPVSRALSHFYFLRQDSLLELVERKSEGYDATELTFTREVMAKVRENELLEFLRKEPYLAAVTLGDVQTRLLDGIPGKCSDLVPAHLESALRHLRSCFFVGITERMDESIALLCQKMGWPIMHSPKALNRTRDKPGKDQQGIWEELSEINQFDQILYKEAIRLFDVAKMANGKGYFPIPDASGFTPLQPMLGDGWQIREKAEGEWVCWTGPEKHAWLELSTTLRATAIMVLMFRQAIHPDVLAQLKLSINGTILFPQRIKDAGQLGLELTIPGKLMQQANGRLRLGIEAPTFRVSDLYPDSPDQRKLGIALSGIDLKKRGFFRNISYLKEGFTALKGVRANQG